MQRPVWATVGVGNYPIAVKLIKHFNLPTKFTIIGDIMITLLLLNIPISFTVVTVYCKIAKCTKTAPEIEEIKIRGDWHQPPRGHNIWVTSSSAVAERPRDALCQSVLSFNSTIPSALVCVLSSIDDVIWCLFFVVRQIDISATVMPIGMKFCMMAEVCPRQCFSMYLGVTKCGIKKEARVDHFGLSDTEFCHLISKTVSRRVTCQLGLNISSTEAF